jgi:hypothetical protein
MMKLVKKCFPSNNKSGQVMVEYIMITVMLISAVAILSVFLYVFKEEGGRILDLAASEYP